MFSNKKRKYDEISNNDETLNEIIDLYEQIDSIYENQLLAGKINN
tara:strand:+ start:1803 stop:1937 length:135 start_codon:yes stop_codon:yes gene_type:complete